MKDFFNTEKSNLLRYLFVLILVGVFFMLVGNLFDPSTQDKSLERVTEDNSQSRERNFSLEEELEKRLEDVLSQVSGAGTVAVNITLDTGTKKIYARNSNDSNKKILEEDKSGGVRETEQQEQRSEIVILDQGGASEAVIKKKVRPQIRGVLVISEGAADSRIKADLIDAVRVGLGIKSHKIKVLAKER
ncbi:MAG: hypothetical protein R6V17_00625 [Halanaerobacter sp.]